LLDAGGEYGDDGADVVLMDGLVEGDADRTVAPVAKIDPRQIGRASCRERV